MIEELQDLADLIISTRDFCGNEGDAVRQWESDNGRKITREERQAVFAEVNSKWRKSQQSAAVMEAYLV